MLKNFAFIKYLTATVIMAFACAATAATTTTGVPEAGTYGYLTGDENYKPVVTLSKTSRKSCKNCGAITDVKLVQDKAKGTGLGAIAGAVGGGLLGNQLGKGRGRTLGTIAGVAGGALAGHEIERRVKTGEKHWDVYLTMDDKKTTHELRFADEPKFSTGERVALSFAK